MAADLLEAAKNGDFQRTRRLLRDGVDVNQRADVDGTTALYWAVCAGHVAICKLLLDGGADVNAVCNDWGSRPLHAAADRGHTQCVSLLISSGADVNLPCIPRRDTALHKAAYRGHYNTCRLLLQKGADTRLVNKEGNVPIQEAQRNTHFDVYTLIQRHEQGKPVPSGPNTHPLGGEQIRNRGPKTSTMPIVSLSYDHRPSSSFGDARAEQAGAATSATSGDDASMDDGAESMATTTSASDSYGAPPDDVFEQFRSLAARCERFEGLAKKLLAMLQIARATTAALKAENAELRRELANAEPLRDALRGTQAELEQLRRRLQSCQRDEAQRSSFVAGVQADGGGGGGGGARHGAAPVYRSRRVPAAEATPSGDDVLFGALKTALGDEDERTLDRLSSVLSERTAALLAGPPSHLDAPRNDWRVCVDYSVEGISTRPDSSGTTSPCQLDIERHGKRYLLQIFRLSKSSVDSEGNGCVQRTPFPLNKNVLLPLYVFDLSADDDLLQVLPPLGRSEYFRAVVYPPEFASLADFVQRTCSSGGRRADVPALPERFVLHLLYGLLSGLSHLHRAGIPHRPLTSGDLRLDRDLCPVIAPESGRPEPAAESVTSSGLDRFRPEVERSSNENTVDLCEKADVLVLGRIVLQLLCICWGVLAPHPATAPDGHAALTSHPVLDRLSSGLRDVLCGMLCAHPERRITADAGRIRVGILLFGPARDIVQSELSYQIWHQVEMMKLLIDHGRRKDDQINSSHECMRTVQSSLRHNDLVLKAEFLTSFPVSQQWHVYRTVNSAMDVVE